MEVVGPDPQGDRGRLIGRKPFDLDVVAGLIRRLLVEIGEDPDREGLDGTPERVARWWQEFMQYDAGRMDTTFEAVTCGQTVFVSGIRTFSLCEHHLLPFDTSFCIAYRSRDRVLGLSKLARIAQHCAHRLQIQERLVRDVAAAVSTLAGTPDVAVMGTGEHLCMVMRGIQAPHRMTTSSYLGLYEADESARREFLALSERPVVQR